MLSKKFCPHCIKQVRNAIYIAGAMLNPSDRLTSGIGCEMSAALSQLCNCMCPAL